jgi:3-hydroxyacyl-[acyl-carrier-protein] dehydratase
MTFKDSFYSIIEKQNTDKGTNFTVRLNADHFIYTAHFPGNPITPGVCITQIVKELTEELVQVPLFLKVVKNIKFIQVINPQQHPEVTFILSTPQKDETGYKVTADIECGGETFAKMNLLLVKCNHELT